MPTKRVSDRDAKILKLAEPIAKLLKEGGSVNIRNSAVRIENIQINRFELVPDSPLKRSK